MSIKQSIQELIDRFNVKVDEDEGLRHELKGLRKRVQIDLCQEKYYFVLDDCKVHSFSEGSIDSPDVVIVSDPATMEGLISRRIRPMKALAMRKLKLRGDIEDLIKLRKFF